LLLAEAPANIGNAVGIAVDAGKVVHTMAGGIGASWHAIADDPRCELAGSAWGGNPPPENAAQWKQLTDYAEWLGLDWMRVEVEQGMYEPERGVFTWDSPEMRTLYHILDWCQQKGVDVFFQQQYSRVAWNSYPEYRNDPLHLVESAPLDMPAFAEGLGTFAFGWENSPPGPGTFEAILKDAEVVVRGLNIGIDAFNKGRQK
jgi:hypothetical protein